MKKKWLCVLLCTGMVVSMAAGCGGQSDDKKTKEKTEDTGEKSDVKADSVEQKKVYVSPEWVQSVIDGNQKESEDYVILECAWGEEEDDAAYGEGHIK